MKKVFLFLFVAVMSMSAMAQKKVAILETVDKSGEISYAIKMMLRNSLTIAISNTPGYEGYDRVDMSSIFKEQEFQRTGLVSDDQIKQLGVATGAAYVLVAEAAKYDAENIIITAKILDVETFGVKNVAMQITGTAAPQMKKACNTLAKKLLDPAASDSEIETTAPARSTWIGIALEGGVFKDFIDESDIANDNYNHRTEYWPVLGVALDFSFAVTKALSIGPFLNIHSYFDDNNYSVGGMAGLMAKYTFRNELSFMLGGGGGYKFLYGEALAQGRVGLKLPNSLYITGTVFFGISDKNNDGGDGFLFGLGYSFGGKKQ